MLSFVLPRPFFLREPHPNVSILEAAAAMADSHSVGQSADRLAEIDRAEKERERETSKRQTFSSLSLTYIVGEPIDFDVRMVHRSTRLDVSIR